MSTVFPSVLPNPTLPSDLIRTSPLSSSTGIDSSSIQNIAFGIFTALIGVVGIIIAYFQLIHMRKARLRDIESGSEAA